MKCYINPVVETRKIILNSFAQSTGGTISEQNTDVNECDFTKVQGQDVCNNQTVGTDEFPMDFCISGAAGGLDSCDIGIEISGGAGCPGLVTFDMKNCKPLNSISCNEGTGYECTVVAECDKDPFGNGSGFDNNCPTKGIGIVCGEEFLGCETFTNPPFGNGSGSCGNTGSSCNSNSECCEGLDCVFPQIGSGPGSCS